MATFKAEILNHHQKQDGTWNVKIRVIHNRQKKYISTNIFVTKKDVTASLRFKDQRIIEITGDIVNSYRKEANEFLTLYPHATCQELINHLTRKEGVNEIDFVEFGKRYVEKLRKEGRTGTAGNYALAINSVVKFKGKKIYFSDITVDFLRKYSAHLIEQKKKQNDEAIKKGKRVTSNRMLSLYLGCLRHLHNEAKMEYNDEDRGIIPIQYSPFAKFKIQKEETTRKRALEPDQIRVMFTLPSRVNTLTRDDKKRDKAQRGTTEKECRYNIAKDIFKLSFYLIGMNSADLYSCTEFDGKSITYYRQKTRSRRSDKAEIKIDIQPEAMELFKKYKDHSGKRVFRFYQIYSSSNYFNAAINKGLKEIGSEMEIEDLEFYAARHSWASIALNDAGVDKYTVHEALNHVDEDMKSTDKYLKKDFRRINEANRKVLDFLFG